TMADTPGALQLRLLETIVEVAAEKNSTLVLPFPVELLRFLENNTNLVKAISATQSAAEKTVSDPENAERPAIAEKLSSSPDVAAVEARKRDQSDRPAINSANGLSPVTQNGS
ncbi:MAG TPA: hypothetical protein VFP81_06015, partial [Propionibacteriaceae bacterium]|nr:hypothetical protein [Propionibacteriaceae bacterium]